MSKSNRRFIKQFNSPMNGIDILFKINNVRNQKDIDYFCCIEGITDERFYSSVTHNFFNMNKIKYLYMGYDESEIKGKKSVVLSTKVVTNSFRKIEDKFIFIVDHDNFGILEYKKDIEDKYLNMLTVLPIYSYENYYFYKQNLNKILSKYLTSFQIAEFKKSFNEFYEEIIVYFSLKAVKTATHVLPKYFKYTNLIEYKPKSKDEDIFYMNSVKKEFYDKELLELEISELNSIVSIEEGLLDLSSQMKKKMSKNMDFIKGKILFRFIVNYFRNNYKIDIIERNAIKEINELLEIEIDIKFQN